MQSSKARWALGIGSVVLAAVLFVLFSADDDELAPSSQVVSTTTEGSQSADGGERSGSTPGAEEAPAGESIPTIVVEGGEPKGGIADLEYNKGDQITFKVDSDIDVEVHVHGYDITKDVSPGDEVEFDFDADIDGVYEVELEESGVQLAQLTVNP